MPVQPNQPDGKDQFRLLVESVRDYAIFGLDVSGRVTSWNYGAEHIKGYRPEEILGRHFSVFYSPEDRAAGIPDSVLAATDHGRCEVQGWRLRRDGTRSWVDVVITAIHNDRHQLIGFGKVTRDVTGRRAVEEALRHSAGLVATNDILRRQAAELSAARDLAERATRRAERQRGRSRPFWPR